MALPLDQFHAYLILNITLSYSEIKIHDLFSTIFKSKNNLTMISLMKSCALYAISDSQPR